jgi:hypothetical protein
MRIDSLPSRSLGIPRFTSAGKGNRVSRSRVLGPGDVILLISGGHGFEVLEELNMVQVKQGPYAGETDKTRFTAVPEKLKFD